MATQKDTCKRGCRHGSPTEAWPEPQVWAIWQWTSGVRSPGEMRRNKRESWTPMLNGLEEQSSHLTEEENGRRPSASNWRGRHHRKKPCPPTLMPGILCIHPYLCTFSSVTLVSKLVAYFLIIIIKIGLAF